MGIYTKKGDRGETSLFGGKRVSKDDARVSAYGNIDELNAAIGAVCAFSNSESLKHILLAIQGDLFAVGAHLADPGSGKAKKTTITGECVSRLEQYIDDAEQRLSPLKEFILPGGVQSAALLHLARAIARRAERHVVTLACQAEAEVDPLIITYLNRLSDMLFVAARAENHDAGAAGREQKWHAT